MDWRLADAKNRFSELVNRALSEGPQRVVRRDDAVIVIRQDEYERLVGNRPSFVEYIRTGPGLDGVELCRDKSPARDAGI